MNTTEIFLIAMIVIFALPYLVWRLARTDYWAPLVGCCSSGSPASSST